MHHSFCKIPTCFCIGFNGYAVSMGPVTSHGMEALCHDWMGSDHSSARERPRMSMHVHTMATRIEHMCMHAWGPQCSRPRVRPSGPRAPVVHGHQGDEVPPDPLLRGSEGPEEAVVAHNVRIPRPSHGTRGDDTACWWVCLHPLPQCYAIIFRPNVKARCGIDPSIVLKDPTNGKCGDWRPGTYFNNVKTRTTHIDMEEGIMKIAGHMDVGVLRSNPRSHVGSR